MDREPGQQLRCIFFTAFILLQAFFILFGGHNFGVGGLDNIRHYQTARFSFLQPELFLDAWGNPLYTILLSPFAQLGFKVARAFNLIISVLILLFTLKISDKVYKQNSLVTIVLIGFTPLYFFITTSCLPALLFGFLLILAIYFFVESKPSLSALVVSFLPVIYFEGFIITGVFALVLLLVKSYKPIFLLLAGTVIFSVGGYLFTGDVLWMIRQPVNSGANITTDTFSLFGRINFNIGFPLLLFLVTGFGVWLAELSKKFSISNKKAILFLLVAGSFLATFAGKLLSKSNIEHEYLEVTLVPLAALIGSKSVEFLSEKMESRKSINIILAALVLIQAVLLFTTNKFSLKIDEKADLAKKGANYLRFNEPNGKIYYFNPLIPYYLDINPFDTVKCSLITNKDQISGKMDWDDLLVWDLEYGKLKYGVDLKFPENDSNLERLESFYLHDKTVMISEDDLSVQIFKKTKEKTVGFVVSDTYTRTLSFEDYIHEKVKEVEGIKAWELDSTQEYSPNIELKRDVVKQKEFLEFAISVKYKALQPLGKGQVLLVFSVINEGKNIHYKSEYLISSESQWKESVMNVTIPADLPKSSRILAYVWNNDRRQLVLERIKVDAKSF